MSVSPTFAALGAVLGFLTILATAIDRRLIILGILGMLFAATIGVAHDYRGMPWIQWLYPLQEQRNIVFGGIALGTLIGAWFFLPPSRSRGCTRAFLFLMVIGVVTGIIRALHAGVNDAALSIMLAVVSTGAILLAANRTVAEWEDLSFIPQVIAWSMFFPLMGSLVQLAIDPNRAFIGNTYR